MYMYIYIYIYIMYIHTCIHTHIHIRCCKGAIKQHLHSSTAQQQAVMVMYNML